MKYNVRLIAVGIVGLFNVFRYFYYHQYLGLPFKANFFILTLIFLVIAWWGGHQFDRVKFLSEKDPLTKTYNRRTVEQSFQKVTQICKRKNQKLGIVMMDLNNFKVINDTYGHQKGDELLNHVATIIKRSIRDNDIVARWGGDEFLILVPNCKEDFQTAYIRNLHQMIENEKLVGITSLGTSVGFAIYPDDGLSFQELLQIADGAMYKEKESKLERTTSELR
ncbi:GGDEF domain-containing protein [Sporosarcina sp. JAI121]|uniref:GGDEF domain-containing protein n=1 Tax=Sporosarcina sp. JAI121 TaxID=2723064 RepID=UPI0015C98B82|nr:diguanylate cyclase (GGDEF)-like protein [Sporosarcina sp. JAI121]